MINKVVVFVLTVAAVSAIESNFYYEETCRNATGSCVLESECHHPVASEHKNLCPGQKKDGAVCCSDFPDEDLNCNQLHNACQSICPKGLNLGRKGCPSGKSCCVLI